MTAVPSDPLQLPLVESGTVPRFALLARHLEYLQKWRECLSVLWTGNTSEQSYAADMQKSIDDTIMAILLLDFIWRTDATVIPSVEEVLAMARRPTAHSLLESVRDYVPCAVLRHVLDPRNLVGHEPVYAPKVKWSALAHQGRNRPQGQSPL